MAIGAVGFARLGLGAGWIILFTVSMTSLNYTAKLLLKGEFVEEYDTTEMIVSSVVSMVTALIGGAYQNPFSMVSTTVWEIITNAISWLSTDPNLNGGKGKESTSIKKIVSSDL